MRIEILYTNKSKHIKPVAEAMARWVKTYAKKIDDFDDCGCVDLMVIGFDDSTWKDGQYSFKLTFKQLKEIDQNVIDGARLYVEDMVNLVRDYY